MFKSNALTVLCSVIIDAVFPFITIGMMWSEVLEYVAVAIFALAVAGLLIGWYMKDRVPQSEPLKDLLLDLGDLLLDLGFPYALTLSGTLTYYYTGKTEAAQLLWIAGAFALLVIIVNVIRLKSANK